MLLIADLLNKLTTVFEFKNCLIALMAVSSLLIFARFASMPNSANLLTRDLVTCKWLLDIPFDDQAPSFR